jgi:hypothetical protein
MTRGRRRSLARRRDNCDHRTQIPCQASGEPDGCCKSLVHKAFHRGVGRKGIPHVTMWVWSPVLRREWVMTPICHEHCLDSTDRIWHCALPKFAHGRP